LMYVNGIFDDPNPDPKAVEAPSANQSAFSPQHVTFETSETPQIGRLPNYTRNASSWL
jgi:hypothetical protein